MKFKPKEVMVNLPVALTFTNEDEIVQMAAAFNTFIHGKVKMKYEVLGILGGQTIGLFYMQRNNESQQLRDEFMRLIEAEEMNELLSPFPTPPPPQQKKQKEPKYSIEEIREMRDRGILINDDGVFCREVPECGCGLCRPEYSDWRP